MENKKALTKKDFKVNLEDYNVKASPVMEEMEASIIASVVIIK